MSPVTSTISRPSTAAAPHTTEPANGIRPTGGRLTRGCFTFSGPPRVVATETMPQSRTATNWLGMAAYALSIHARLLLRDFTNPQAAGGARTEVEAQFQAKVVQATRQGQIRNNLHTAQLLQSLKQIQSAFPWKTFELVQGQNTLGTNTVRTILKLIE